MCKFTTDIKFGAETTSTLSSKISPVTMIPENTMNILLTSIYSLCGAVVFIMFIVCLILSLVFLKLLKKKAQEYSTSQVQCLEDDIATPATEADMDNLKVDLSFYDKIDIDSAPGYKNIGASVQ